MNGVIDVFLKCFLIQLDIFLVFVVVNDYVKDLVIFFFELNIDCFLFFIGIIVSYLLEIFVDGFIVGL